jgi:hypothetical protein
MRSGSGSRSPSRSRRTESDLSGFPTSLLLARSTDGKAGGACRYPTSSLGATSNDLDFGLQVVASVAVLAEAWQPPELRADCTAKAADGSSRESFCRTAMSVGPASVAALRDE